MSLLDFFIRALVGGIAIGLAGGIVTITMYIIIDVYDRIESWRYRRKRKKDGYLY